MDISNLIEGEYLAALRRPQPIEPYGAGVESGALSSWSLSLLHAVYYSPYYVPSFLFLAQIAKMTTKMERNLVIHGNVTYLILNIFSILRDHTRSGWTLQLPRNQWPKEV